MLQPIPHGATARRLEWSFLPPRLRDLVARRLGSAVVHAASCGGGFTPGMASVLTCEDGTRHFVKAASVKAQREFAAAYAEEARRLALLPPGVPAPRLRWWHRDEDWVVLAIEHVPGVPAPRPWTDDDLDRALDALEECAHLLTPAPPGLAPATFAEEMTGAVAAWAGVRHDLPGLAEHAAEAARLAASHVEVTAGGTAVHTDVRDDNVLVGPHGEVWLCDWNFPARGAAWIDTVDLLLGPRGDGVDVDALLASRSLTRDVPPDHVDRLIALMAGFYLQARDRPVPPASPWLRAHQDQCAQVAWGWLAERRGWIGPAGAAGGASDLGAVGTA
ncbi:phosphotransferase [uncultured Nocardioides sp.]|uniref:phosphotransferase n=1 Tax=uncultured Nocardioides sp. TaxID=198441 RepID=UPI00260FDACC|nr:phosphotransferase [uncultured Nocardioides sp.]